MVGKGSGHARLACVDGKLNVIPICYFTILTKHSYLNVETACHLKGKNVIIVTLMYTKIRILQCFVCTLDNAIDNASEISSYVGNFTLGLNVCQH